MYTFNITLADHWRPNGNVKPHKVSKKLGTSHILKHNKEITGWFKFKSKEKAERHYIQCIRKNMKKLDKISKDANTEEGHKTNDNNLKFIDRIYEESKELYIELYPELFI